MEHEFFSKSQENLQAAELLFEHGLHNASTNRAYYAAFHAAIAALADIGVTVEIGERISHKGVHSSFTTELIQRRKIYANPYRSYLAALQLVRNNADYKSAGISKKVASQQLKKAREFVETISKRIKT